MKKAVKIFGIVAAVLVVVAVVGIVVLYNTICGGRHGMC